MDALVLTEGLYGEVTMQIAISKEHGKRMVSKVFFLRGLRIAPKSMSAKGSNTILIDFRPMSYTTSL